MFKAKDKFIFNFKNYPEVKASFLSWPLSVIRLKSKKVNSLIELSTKILSSWKNYSDKELNIIASSNNERHNTITPIVHKEKDIFVIDLVLRNNNTSDKYPLGIFHPHEEYWNIKKENIGLIEVMGLAVLPGRLKNELSIVKNNILNAIDFSNDPTIGKHYKWSQNIKNKYQLNKNNIDEVFNNEIGNTFADILSCCGVFKLDDNCYENVMKFINTIN